jgi:hypothetical protein
LEGAERSAELSYVVKHSNLHAQQRLPLPYGAPKCLIPVVVNIIKPPVTTCIRYNDAGLTVLEENAAEVRSKIGR